MKLHNSVNHTSHGLQCCRNKHQTRSISWPNTVKTTKARFHIHSIMFSLVCLSKPKSVHCVSFLCSWCNRVLTAWTDSGLIKDILCIKLGAKPYLLNLNKLIPPYLKDCSSITMKRMTWQLELLWTSLDTLTQSHNTYKIICKYEHNVWLLCVLTKCLAAA